LRRKLQQKKLQLRKLMQLKKSLQKLRLMQHLRQLLSHTLHQLPLLAL